MIIELDYFQHQDYITVPAHVGKNIDDIKVKFYTWLNDKGNDHKYWIYHNGQKDGLLVNTEGLVEWLNTHYLKQESAKIIEGTPEIIGQVEKRIWF
ncbi:hypothetical protein V1503_24370 [Bacillus sp. SCS-151]|uniref:hypothetical protein n=1 Tax=Nanhaiella sioensis TaxID=3115293 RepID=UPI00397D14FB